MFADYAQAAELIPYVPDAIVYVVNEQVTKIVPIEEVPKFERGFNAPIRDAEGNVTIKWADTVLIKTVFKDDAGNMVPEEEATLVNTLYL